jgi:hypothetical protein
MVMVMSSYALTNEQLNKTQDIYTIGKSIKAKDGMTFEKGLASIFGQESSFGVYVVGDKWEDGKLKSLYESSLGNLQIKLSTAKLTIKKFPNLKKKYKHLIYKGKSIYLNFQKHKGKMEYYENIVGNGVAGIFEDKLKKSEDLKKIRYYNKILNNPTWIDRYERKTKKGLSTFKWAKKELAYHEARYDSLVKKLKKTAQKDFSKALKKLTFHKTKYNSLLVKANKDTKLINKLLTDHKFGAEIGGHYLKWMYEIALNKGYSNAYWRAIGRYNGGWNNKTYQGKVKKRMELIETLIKEGKIL